MTNTGTNAATAVNLTDVLPENTTFVSADATCNGLTAGDTNGTLVCNFGPVGVGAANAETVTFVVQTTAEAGVVGQVSNTATADGSNTAPASDTEPTLVQPRVSITKNDRPNAVEIGEFIVYTLTVTNNTTSAQTVRIRDALPDEVDFEDVASDSPTCQETAQNSNVVRCEIVLDPAGNPGDSATVQIVVQAEEEGTAQNTAQAFLGTTLVDQATVETDVEGNNPPPNPPPPPVPDDPDDDFFDDDDNDGIPDGFDDDFDDDFSTQEEQYEDAENDLNGEGTDGELTDGQYDDEGNDGVSATSDGDGAEASTPGASASSGGDPDEQAPVSGEQGDVVDEVPTSGPLPNTGGVPVAAGTVLALVLFGGGLLAVRLVMIWRERRA